MASQGGAFARWGAASNGGGHLAPTALAAVLGAAVIAWAGPPPPRPLLDRGWAPLLRLVTGEAGRPRVDPSADPVAALARGLEVAGAVLHGLEVDATTRGFVDGVRRSLERFDLGGFHAGLPHPDGAWRRLRVTGARAGDRYRVVAVPDARGLDPTGHGGRPGDLALDLAARPHPGGEAFAFAASLGVGTGRVGLADLAAAAREAGRLLVSGDPRAPHRPRDRAAQPQPPARLRVLEACPRLRPEDMDVVATLAEAFPELSAHLLALGPIEDVAVLDLAGDGRAQQLRLVARLEPERMAGRWPALARHAAGLGPLLRLEGRLLDGERRPWLRFGLDTEALRVRLEAFLHDGVPVPVDGRGRVVVEAVGADARGPWTVELDARSDVNGVVTELRGLRLEAEAASHEASLRLRAVPQVTTSGSAFGMIPAWLIDVVIPGDLEGLVRDFFVTAAATEGGGARWTVRARQAPDGGPTVLEAEARLDVRDSALVAFVARVAGMKLLKSDAARDELWGLLGGAHRALEADLTRFARAR